MSRDCGKSFPMFFQSRKKQVHIHIIIIFQTEPKVTNLYLFLRLMFRLKQGVLELACRCLNFDFIGNMPHDAEAEAGTIQVFCIIVTV